MIYNFEYWGAFTENPFPAAEKNPFQEKFI